MRSTISLTDDKDSSSVGKPASLASCETRIHQHTSPKVGGQVQFFKRLRFDWMKVGARDYALPNSTHFLDGSEIKSLLWT